MPARPTPPILESLVEQSETKELMGQSATANLLPLELTGLPAPRLELTGLPTPRLELTGLPTPRLELTGLATPTLGLSRPCEISCRPRPPCSP